jgi:hypothetical protein
MEYFKAGGMDHIAVMDYVAVDHELPLNRKLMCSSQKTLEFM